jgi:ubiquinone/menaquinone biosynthesis C-methylase UbiE
MLQVARDVTDGRAIEWLEASADALPLEDATFDVAFCQMGLQFFSDRLGALREMRRVLRPGGRVILNVPGPTPPVFVTLEQLLRRHAGRETGGFVATVFSLYESDEVRGLLNRAGFTDVDASSERKTFMLPPAEDFLWEYVYSTPLADAVAALDEDAHAELQQEVANGWEPFTANGALVLEVDVTSAIGKKP